MGTMVNKRNSLKKTGFLIYVLGFAFACRILVAIIANGDQSRYIAPDSNDYIKLADHLAAGLGYTKGDEPEIFRAPGYPFFLAQFRRLFSDNFLPVVLMQIVLSVSSIFLLWHLAMLVGGGNIKVANLAALFQALTLTSVVFSNKILSETLFTFLLIFFFLLLELVLNSATTADDKGTKKTWHLVILAISAGCVAATALMVRAILLPILPLCVLYVIIRIMMPYANNASIAVPTKNSDLETDDYADVAKEPFLSQLRKNLTLAFSMSLFFLLPIFIVYGSWCHRNSRVANFAGFSSVGQINIYRYYACLLLAKNNGKTFAEQQALCTGELEARGKQAQQAEYAMKKGLPILMKEPVRYFFMHLKTDISSLLPDVGDLYHLLGFEIGGSGTLSVIRTKGILAGVKHYFDGRWGLFFLAMPLVVLMFAKFAAATTGAVFAFKSPVRMKLLFYVVIILYMLVVPGGVSHPRFRVPVEPLLSLLAAFGCVWMIDFFKTKHQLRS